MNKPPKTSRLTDTQRRLAAGIRAPAEKLPDASFVRKTATGRNQIDGIVYPAVIDVQAGDWCLVAREGAGWTILGPINGTSIEADTYEPSVPNVTFGTDPRREGAYVYVGGPNSGDLGVITVWFWVLLGSGSPAVTGQPSVSLPSGFQAISQADHGLGVPPAAGQAYILNGSSYAGYLSIGDRGNWYALPASGSYVGAPVAVNATTPVTWGAGYSARGGYSTIVRRT